MKIKFHFFHNWTKYKEDLGLFISDTKFDRFYVCTTDRAYKIKEGDKICFFEIFLCSECGKIKLLKIKNSKNRCEKYKLGYEELLEGLILTDNKVRKELTSVMDANRKFLRKIDWIDENILRKTDSGAPPDGLEESSGINKQ